VSPEPQELLEPPDYLDSTVPLGQLDHLVLPAIRGLLEIQEIRDNLEISGSLAWQVLRELPGSRVGRERLGQQDLAG